MQYWPNASRWMPTGEPERLFTHNASLSLKDAGKVITGWRDEHKYILLEAWIDIFDGDRKVRTYRYTMDEIKRLRA